MINAENLLKLFYRLQRHLMNNLVELCMNEMKMAASKTTIRIFL